MKQFGKKRATDCKCEARFTCGACLQSAAVPTPAVHSAQKFAVIYIWQGARHRVLETFTNKQTAADYARELSFKGLQAFVEEI